MFNPLSLGMFHPPKLEQRGHFFKSVRQEQLDDVVSFMYLKAPEPSLSRVSYFSRCSRVNPRLSSKE